MKTSNTNRFSMQRCVLASLLLLLTLLPAVASAQGVLAQSQTGTLELLRQDDGYITISGRNYGYDEEQVEISLQGEVVDSGILDEGMVVRYTLDGAGNLVQIEVLGPFTKLEILDQN